MTTPRPGVGPTNSLENLNKALEPIDDWTKKNL